MNRLIRSAAVTLAFVIAVPVLAQETVPEKAEAAGNDVKRGVKKGADRVDEALCTGTKAECAGKKVKHRVNEKKDEAVDATKKAVNKVD